MNRASLIRTALEAWAVLRFRRHLAAAERHITACRRLRTHCAALGNAQEEYERIKGEL